MDFRNNKLILKFKNDYIFRTLICSIGSLLITLIITLYNLFLAYVYESKWSICIAIYYVLLFIIRCFVLVLEYTHIKKHRGLNYNYNLYIIESVYLLLIDISLITPITLLTLEEKDIHYSEISAITLATYTCYKIIISSINYKKTRHIDFFNIRTLRSVNFIDALVSILNLQYALIQTFDNTSNNDDMYILTIVSSFLIYCFIIFVSVKNLKNACKLKRNYKSNMC